MHAQSQDGPMGLLPSTPHRFGTLENYPLFPSKGAVLRVMYDNLSKFSRAWARKLPETRFLLKARANKGQIFTFSLFHNRNALINARKYSMHQKCTHISHEKWACPPPSSVNGCVRACNALAIGTFKQIYHHENKLIEKSPCSFTMKIMYFQTESVSLYLLSDAALMLYAEHSNILQLLRKRYKETTIS